MDKDYIESTADDLFAALNKDPFSSGGGKDNYNTDGDSLFNHSSNPLFDMNNGNNVSNNNSSENGEKLSTGEPIFDVILNIFIVIGNLIKDTFISLMDIPTVIIEKPLNELYKMIRSFCMIFAPIAVIFLGITLFGYYTDNTIAFVGVTGLIGCLFNEFISLGIFGTIKLNTYKPQTEEDLKEFIEKEKEEKIKDVDPEQIEIVNDLAEDYTESFDDIMNEILGVDTSDSTEDEDMLDLNSDTSSESSFVWEDDDVEDIKTTSPNEIEMPKGVVNSSTLFKTLYSVFPAINPNFAKTKKYETGSEEWVKLFAIITNVFKDLYGTDETEIVNKGINLLDVENAIMFTKLIIQKPRGKQVTAPQITAILENYSDDLIKVICNPKQLFKGVEAADCNKLSFSVELKGDKIEIVMSKPNSSAILLGDVFSKPEVQEFMSDPKANMPIVVAVDELGQPIMAEFSKKSKEVYSALIGGGAGSGKSWFFSSLAAQMVTFNLPEDLQMILCDPKGDTTFNKLALMPQVCRLIQGGSAVEARQIYDMLRLLVEQEAPRRQEIFKQHNCANIQDYRKQGKKMPFLIAFVDEYLSVRDAMNLLTEADYKEKLEEWQEACDEAKANKTAKPPKPVKIDFGKELDNTMRVAVTKLRSAGIYIFIISHRFTGAVDKTTREQTAFRAVLRSEKLKEEVFSKDELKDFSKKLINSGNAAIKIGEGKVRGAQTLGINLEDADTFRLFEGLAKEFYRMGVELPDMSPLGKEYVKDINKVKAELYNENITQFDENSIKNNEKIDNSENEEDDLFVFNEDEEENTNSKLNNIDHIDEDGTIHMKNEFVFNDDSEDDEIKEPQKDIEDTDDSFNFDDEKENSPTETDIDDSDFDFDFEDDNVEDIKTTSDENNENIDDSDFEFEDNEEDSEGNNEFIFDEEEDEEKPKNEEKGEDNSLNLDDLTDDETEGFFM